MTGDSRESNSLWNRHRLKEEMSDLVVFPLFLWFINCIWVFPFVFFFSSSIATGTVITNYRYDVRAALTDIGQHEPPPGGYDNRLDYLNAAEQKAELLCEEERYFSLYNNDIEEELYQGMNNFGV